MANPFNLIKKTITKSILTNVPSIELPDGSFVQLENILTENSPLYKTTISAEDSEIEFPFLLLTFLPGTAIPTTLGQTGKNRLFGIYQLSIYTEKYMGESYSYTITDALYSYFKRGITLYYAEYGIYVKITDTRVGRTDSDEVSFFTPFEINWYADYTPNSL